MKKLICALFIFTALSASFTSCQNDDNINASELSTNNEATSTVEESEPFDNIKDALIHGEYDPATNMSYALNDDGKSYSACPMGLSDVVKELVFPGEYKGLPVTKAYSFLVETSIETIIISEGIKEISSSFSYRCSGIKNIYIPASVTHINQDAFNSRTTMGEGGTIKSNVIEKIVVAEENPYYHVDGNCLIETKSKKVVLGCNSSFIPVDGSVESIGIAAFANCKSIETVILPKSIEKIENDAFNNCPNLKKVYITSSVSKDYTVVNFDPEPVFGRAPLDLIFVPDAESLEAYSKLLGDVYFNIGTPDILSADEVRQTAWDYWDIEPNSKDSTTGFPFSVFVEFHGDFYFVDLKWLVENHHFSNIDSIVMDAYTGKVIELVGKG